MKKIIFLLLFSFLATQTVFSQTKKIAHRSHSGSDAQFVIEDDLDNFGDPMSPEEMKNYMEARKKQDSIDNVIYQQKIKALKEQQELAKDPLYKSILETEKKQLEEAKKQQKPEDGPNCKPTQPKKVTPNSKEKEVKTQPTPSKENKLTNINQEEVQVVKSEIPTSGSNGLLWLGFLLAVPCILFLWGKVK